MTNEKEETLTYQQVVKTAVLVASKKSQLRRIKKKYDDVEFFIFIVPVIKSNSSKDILINWETLQLSAEIDCKIN